MTGTQVNSSYQNFTGKNVAVLVATTSTIKEIGENNGSLDKGAGITSAYGAGKNVPLITTNVDTVYNDGGNKVKLSYINYNSILGKYVGATGEGGEATPATITRGTLRFDQNCYRWSEGFVSVNGKVQFNNISGNMNKSGMMEYVSSGARFQSYLIKDESGTIMGVAFEQIGTGN